MKLKYMLLIGLISCAAVLGGCAEPPTLEPIETVQETTEEGETSEEPEEVVTEEETALDESETMETVPEQNEQVDQEEQEKEEETVTEDKQADDKMEVLTAYQEILKASPAIEGEHDELMNAGFGYEDNQKLFGDHYDGFTIVDLNQDKIPELLTQSVINFRWTIMDIYTYVDGNAVLVKNLVENSANDPELGTVNMCSVANGGYSTYICELDHLHVVWNGTNPMGDAEEENQAYVLDGTNLVGVECSVGESENATYFSETLNTPENADAITQN